MATDPLGDRLTDLTKLLFIFDFDDASGFGHMSRSLRLAAGLKNRGVNVFIALRPWANHLMGELVLRGFSPKSVVQIPPTGTGFEENFTAGTLWKPSELSQVLRDHEFKAVALDSYRLEAGFIDAMRQCKITTFVISDNPLSESPDFLLDYGFDACSSKYPNLAPAVKCLFGPLYALLPEKSKEASPKVNDRSVLLALGGGDYLATYLELSKSSRWRKHSVSPSFVVTDPTDPRAVELSSLWPVVTPGANLASSFSEHSLVVSGAGVTLLERLASGVDGIAIVTAPNQIGSLLAMSRQLQIKFLTIEDLSNHEVFFDNLFECLDAPLGPAGAIIVQSHLDGHGVGRVCNEIIIPRPDALSIRRAIPADAPILWRWANDEVTRSASLKPQTIAPDEHLAWFNSASQRRESIFIGEVEGVPVGVVRFRDNGAIVRMSYGLAPEARGKGLAQPLLKLAMQAEKGREVIAQVLANNSKSINVLRGVGFDLKDSRESVLTFAIQL